MITFAPVLKYGTFPLTELLTDILDLGKLSMGCPVEVEFAVNIFNDPDIQDVQDYDHDQR